MHMILKCIMTFIHKMTAYNILQNDPNSLFIEIKNSFDINVYK